MINKVNMAKLANEKIFNGKNNYAKLILTKINMNEITATKMKLV
jgi:hypothetical protein